MSVQGLRSLGLVCWFLLSFFWGGGIVLGQAATTLEVDIPRADTTSVIQLPDIYVRDRYKARPLTEEERRAYWRRVRDVKKTLPYARYVAATIIETYEYMESLSSEKERKEHLNRVERDLKEEMEPKMRQLTLRQGQLLIKLIHRQCGLTSYELVQAFLGNWKAWMWSVFAKVVGANLKAGYDPEGNDDDALTERIVRLHDLGLL